MGIGEASEKQPEQWKKEILDAAKELFLSKGYEETAITDIMELAGGAKGMFYRFFQSKEEVMHALGDQMFLENNPFEAVRGAFGSERDAEDPGSACL